MLVVPRAGSTGEAMTHSASRQRLADSLAAALGLLVAAILSSAAAVQATNFGGPKDAGYACDPTMSSQCVAQDATHTVNYDSSLVDSNWKAGMDSSLSVYDVNTNLTVLKESYGPNNDVRVAEVNTSNGFWGWTRCSGTPTATGTLNKPVPTYALGLNWCYPQLLFLNDKYATTAMPPYNNINGKTAIACHEFGHSTGLRHRNTSPFGCMLNPPTAGGIWYTTPQPHDYTFINAFYP